PNAPVAHNPCVTGLPGNQGQGRKVSNGHKVGVVWFLPQAPNGKSRKPCAIVENVIEMANWHGLGLGNSMDVDKLGEHELDLMFLQKRLSFVTCHEISPLSWGWSA